MSPDGLAAANGFATKLSITAWLLYGGLVFTVLATFFTFATVSYITISQDVSLPGACHFYGHAPIRCALGAPQPLCRSWTRPSRPTNVGGVCDECRLVVHNRLDVTVEERWRDHRDGEHVVPDRGRTTRVVHVDSARRGRSRLSPGTEVSVVTVRTTTEEAREYAWTSRILQGRYATLTKGI